MATAVFISIFLMAGLPIWLTPIAHLAELIRKGFASLAKRSTVVEQDEHFEPATRRLVAVPVRS